jgi:hypothetical protein
MSARDFDTHRCVGSLRARCSIRRYPERTPNYTHRDGHWHLYQEDYDTDYMTGYLRHVARIRRCPWCGEEL